MVPICLDKSPHQINSLWADFSKQMGTICLGQTTLMIADNDLWHKKWPAGSN
jgi:hypothetical protein